MQNKSLQNTNPYLQMEEHPTIKGLRIIEGKNNFSISWLNKMGYCEYQLYLEHLKGIITPPTPEMKKGTKVHQKLEDNFKKTATPATLDEMIQLSETEEILSREMFVISKNYGIRGFIDEIWMTPEHYVIIDDKPGNKAYKSQIDQVRAYCLAFKDMTQPDRPLIAALRQRGTDNIFYKEEFNEKNEYNITQTVNRMHSLLEGKKPFMHTKNKNKCKSCRFQNQCQYATEE
jgi:CRISPR-associated exonuclease Cas4